MGKGRKKNGGKDSCKLPFHYVFRAALTSGAANIAANPAGLSARAGIEADVWGHFRIPSLSFRLHPSATITADQAAGFVGGVQDTAPGTLQQVVELLPSCIRSIQSLVPSEWVRVPKLDLAGPLPWYKTVVGNTDPTEEYPGFLVIAGTGSEVYMVEVKGVFEFKTSLSSGNSPVERLLRTRMREERQAGEFARSRELLLKILGSGQVSAVSALAALK